VRIPRTAWEGYRGTEHRETRLNGSEAFSFKRYTVPDALTLGAALAGAMSVGI